MKITRTSTLTGLTRTKDLPITPEQLAHWQDGALIQDVMLELSSFDREFIISGITEEEWNRAFKE